MRQARKLGLVTGFLVTMVVAIALPATAQVVKISVEGVSLSGALDLFSKRTGVGVVFADRLVADLQSSCTYGGSKYTEALDCILRGTGLEASWARQDQVVLTRIQTPQVPRQLSGRVFDIESGESLPGAHVITADQHSGVVTNEIGQYYIKASDQDSVLLIFTHLGYESKEVTYAPGDDEVHVFLQPQTLEGEAVLVEDSRNTLDEELSGPVQPTVESYASYGSSLEDGAFGIGTAATTGISRTGEVSGQFVVRGGLPDQNVFKIDGAPVYQPWHSQGLFSVLQPSMVQGIDLFAGPLPVDQGGYLASVLDAELSAGGTSVTTTAALSSTVGEVAFSSPIVNGVTAMFAGRRSHPGLNRTHSLSLPNNEQLDGGSFYDLAAKVGVSPNRTNHYYFTLYRGSDNLDWSGEGDADIEIHSDRWSNGVYAFGHRYIAGNRLMVANSFYVSTLDAFSALGETQQPSTGTEDSRQLRDAAMKIDVDYALSATHALKTGAEFIQHHLEWTDRRGADSYNDEVMEGAVFAHDTWNVTDRLVVRPGLRVSWFGNGVGFFPEPRFHAMYTVSTATVLHASWSRQVQYLHQVNDIVSGGLGSTVQRWMVASDNSVKPSTGQQANIGLTAQAGPRWTISAHMYWRDFENVFLPRDQVTIAFPFKVTSINRTGGFSDFEQGSTKAYGAEFTGRYRNKWFMFTGSYTGSRSLFRVQSQLASGAYRAGVYDTPHMVRSSTGYVGSRFSMILSAEARTGYPTMASIRGSAHQIGGDRLPTYFRLDASIGYRFSGFGFNWNIQGRMYNVTDRQNVVGYEYDRELLYLSRTSLLGVTRWPSFHIQVSS